MRTENWQKECLSVKCWPDPYVADASGQTTNFTYNAFGQVTSGARPAGDTARLNYDNRGFLQSFVPSEPGSGVTFTYDNVGRVLTRTNATMGTVTYHYDDGDRLTQIDYSDGTHEFYSYTNLDLTSYTDRQSRTTSYTYDADRRRTSMTDPKTQTTRYGWCSCGSLVSIQDPKNNLTTWDYDLESRVVQKTYQDGSFYKYQYDAGEGGLVLATDGLKQSIQYMYDVDNRLLGINYLNSKNLTPNVSFQYDLILGRMTQMIDGTGATNYTYYPIGQLGGTRIQTISQPIGGTTANITYSYDPDGRIISRFIDGVTEAFGFNSSTGQLASTTNSLGGFAYVYDPNSARLTEIDYPNGQKTNYDYYSSSDPMGFSGNLKNLTNLGGGSLAC